MTNSEKPKLLSIAMATTLKNNDHAGGKTNFCYISKLLKDYDITLINRLSKNEMVYFDEKKLPEINYIITNDYKPGFFVKCINKLIVLSGNEENCLFWKYIDTNAFISKIKLLKKQNYNPEIVILDWTQCIIFAKYVKKAFPKAKLIGCEQDVTFLYYERQVELQKDKKSKKIAAKKYKNIKKQELSALKLLDQIVVFNSKDAELLPQFKEKIKVISPFYTDFSGINRKPQNRNLVFYGHMGRPANYESAIWFIENVFNRLPQDYNLMIVGGNPPEILKKYESNRIIITGFVDDISIYFEKAMCLVSPLLLGAGIKVKILEAMSAGVPVITNAIGIEGIPAENGKDYIHCEAPEDYVKAITELSENEKLQKDISENCRKLIENNFDYKNSSYI